MNSDKPLLNRHSIRLKGYDYSKAGAYFITICVKGGIHFFGKIQNGEMILNDAGIMIDKWWQKIPEKFPDIELGEYRIMPNHFHAIAINTGIVRADPGVRPDKSPNNDIVRADPGVRPNKSPNNDIVRADPGVRPENDAAPISGEHMGSPLHFASTPILGEHTGSPLRTVVQWFKTMSANEYIRGVKYSGWQPFNGKLWHRNYYEHIIRDEKSYNNIANYIINNPKKWDEDKFNI